MRRLPAAASLLGLVVGVAALGVLAPQAMAQGCPMCKTALTNSPEGRAMAASLNRAILLMVAAPYVVFGTGAAIFFRRRLAAAVARVRARLVTRLPEPQPAP